MDTGLHCTNYVQKVQRHMAKKGGEFPLIFRPLSPNLSRKHLFFFFFLSFRCHLAPERKLRRKRGPAAAASGGGATEVCSSPGRGAGAEVQKGIYALVLLVRIVQV